MQLNKVYNKKTPETKGKNAQIARWINSIAVIIKILCALEIISTLDIKNNDTERNNLCFCFRNNSFWWFSTSPRLSNTCAQQQQQQQTQLKQQQPRQRAYIIYGSEKFHFRLSISIGSFVINFWYFVREFFRMNFIERFNGHSANCMFLRERAHTLIQIK